MYIPSYKMAQLKTQEDLDNLNSLLSEGYTIVQTYVTELGTLFYLHKYPERTVINTSNVTTTGYNGF